MIRRFLSIVKTSTNTENGFIIKNHYDINSINSDFRIKKIPLMNHRNTNLVASLEFSGFMPDHLDFISFLAKILSLKSGIPTSPIISKPTQIKKVNTLVSPFVHSKTKNVFEEKTYIRVLQIYDTHLDNIEVRIN